jgi:hypothetical protein
MHELERAIAEGPPAQPVRGDLPPSPLRSVPAALQPPQQRGRVDESIVAAIELRADEIVVGGKGSVGSVGVELIQRQVPREMTAKAGLHIQMKCSSEVASTLDVPSPVEPDKGTMEWQTAIVRSVASVPALRFAGHARETRILVLQSGRWCGARRSDALLRVCFNILHAVTHPRAVAASGFGLGALATGRWRADAHDRAMDNPDAMPQSIWTPSRIMIRAHR